MEKQEAKSVGELMGRFTVQKSHGGVNSPFNDAVDQVMHTITDVKWSFSRWCGFLRNIPSAEILEYLQCAKKSQNPGRHFMWRVKQYRLGE